MSTTIEKPQSGRRNVSVDDKFELREGTAFMTGVQAMVHIPLEQAWRDADAGLRTGTMISGYPGSPIGGYDLLLHRAKRYLEPLNIQHVPAVNEEIAAAIVHGAHMSEIYGGWNVDAITGIWYGKNPGLMRSIDVMKTAHMGGLPERSAVLAMVGDDPLGKSSAGPNYSEYDFFTMGMPVLFPGSPDEVLTLGLHGIAMSRFSGCWVGLKIVTNIADGGASVHVGPERPTIVRPELPGFERFYTFRLGPPLAVTSEQALFEWRLPAAVAYGRANNLNAIVQRGPQDRIGLVAAGKTFTDLRQSLEDMGIGPAELERAGIRLLKVGMVFPFDDEGFRAFADGLEHVVVVEEKRDLLQSAIERALYPLSNRPAIAGNRGLDGRLMFPGWGELDADEVSQRLGPFLLEQGVGFGIERRLEEIAVVRSRAYGPAAPRIPAYCSGCPHNRSTVRLGDEIVAGGNGCHGMAQIASQPKRQTVNAHVMGIDGTTWGARAISPTTSTSSRTWATARSSTPPSSRSVRAVAAGTNITFKLLYNKAVAMTGGQESTGGLESRRSSRRWSPRA